MGTINIKKHKEVLTIKRNNNDTDGSRNKDNGDEDKYKMVGNIGKGRGKG